MPKYILITLHVKQMYSILMTIEKSLIHQNHFILLIPCQVQNNFITVLASLIVNYIMKPFL